MRNLNRSFLILILGCCLIVNSQGQTSVRLQRSTPEQEGISSKGIIDFVNAIDTGKTEIHSFMFIRHGKVVAEGWWNPYGPDLKHIMYSASKTFTATAIGLAVSENRLKLTDKVVSFFPASLPDTISDLMKSMTVKDLLMMATGIPAEPRFGQNDEWVRSFLSMSPAAKPGTVFKYFNMATFMLSAIVQQVTGETIYNYLQPRIFKPLEIKGIDWDLNPQGINLGMIGLRLRTEDMAKFGQLLIQKGNWNGKQLIPEEWVKEATSFKIKSEGGSANIPPELNDWVQGYCYQMWRGRNNSVRLDGMAGQFVILLPDKDAIVVLTANAANTQKELDLVWNYLYPAIKDSKPLPADQNANNELGKKLAALSIKTTSVPSQDSHFQTKVSGKSVTFDENNYGIQGIGFRFNNDICELSIKRENISYNIKAGKDSWVRSNTLLTSLLSAPRPASKSVDANYSILHPVIRPAGYYTWTDVNTLDFTVRFVEETLGAEGVIIKFSEEAGSINVSLTRKGGRGPVPGQGAQSAPIVLTGKINSN
ncbi:MAG: serine hydrolase [Bacteroidales bacterium]|nr:serine hydrolase [Bacteroidales bacterium]